MDHPLAWFFTGCIFAGSLSGFFCYMWGFTNGYRDGKILMKTMFEHEIVAMRCAYEDRFEDLANGKKQN